MRIRQFERMPFRPSAYSPACEMHRRCRCCVADWTTIHSIDLWAAEAIWHIAKDKQVFAVILRELADPQSMRRLQAMQLLSEVCGDAPELYDDVVRYVKDPDIEVRREVIEAAYRLGKTGVPILIQGLEDAK